MYNGPPSIISSTSSSSCLSTTTKRSSDPVSTNTSFSVFAFAFLIGVIIGVASALLDSKGDVCLCVVVGNSSSSEGWDESGGFVWKIIHQLRKKHSETQYTPAFEFAFACHSDSNSSSASEEAKATAHSAAGAPCPDSAASANALGSRAMMGTRVDDLLEGMMIRMMMPMMMMVVVGIHLSKI